MPERISSAWAWFNSGSAGIQPSLRRKLEARERELLRSVALIRYEMFLPIKFCFSSLRATRLRLAATAILLVLLATTSACTRSNASPDNAPSAAVQSPQPVQSQPSATQSQPASSPTELTPELAQLQRKAESGNAQAMFELGSAYEKGEGAPKDPQQATTWFTKAADAGNASAMYRLGRMYAKGSGGQKDYVEAFDWYKRAAAAGNSEAMYDLGHAYETGSGVREDVQQAVIWYTKAYKHGNQTAKAALVRLGEGFEDHE